MRLLNGGVVFLPNRVDDLSACSLLSLFNVPLVYLQNLHPPLAYKYMLCHYVKVH